MTDSQGPPTRWPENAQLLLWDLARIAGTLSEIATVWRRAKPYLPELPLNLPVQLQDATRQIAADIRALAGEDPIQSHDQTVSAADRFRALQQCIVSAQALTCGPGIPEVGDGGLWESLSGPLNRTGTQLTALSPRPVLVRE